MARINLRLVLFALACFLGTSGSIVARTATAGELEAPSPRQGYYASLSLHGAGLFVWNRGDAEGVRTGSALGLRLGQMLTSRFGLGILLFETSGSANKKDTTGFSGFAVLEAQLRIWDTLALSAGSGLGVVQITRKNPDDPDDKSDGSYGAYTTLGLTYDFFPYRKPLSGGLAISPALRFRFLPGSPLDVLGILVGVEFTWWTGLPKNQLDLPPDRAF